MKFLFIVFLIVLGVLLYKNASRRLQAPKQKPSATGPLLGKAQFGFAIAEYHYLELSERLKQLPEVIDTGYEQERGDPTEGAAVLWVYCEPESLDEAKRAVSRVLNEQRGAAAQAIRFLDR